MSMLSSLRLKSGTNSLPIPAWNVPATRVASEFLNFLKSNLSVDWVAFWSSSDELERSSLPGHGHFLCLLQGSSLSYIFDNRLGSEPGETPPNRSV